jgi:hypothetical protein
MVISIGDGYVGDSSPLLLPVALSKAQLALFPLNGSSFSPHPLRDSDAQFLRHALLCIASQVQDPDSAVVLCMKPASHQASKQLYIPRSRWVKNASKRNRNPVLESRYFISHVLSLANRGIKWALSSPAW